MKQTVTINAPGPFPALCYRILPVRAFRAAAELGSGEFLKVFGLLRPQLLMAGRCH